MDLRQSISGSLSDELSSYGEDDMEDRLLSTGEFLHNALSMCYTIDEIVMAEAQLVEVEVPSPEIRSVSSFAGEKNGRLASQVVKDVARRRLAGKPWRGPLPTAGTADITGGYVGG